MEVIKLDSFSLAESVCVVEKSGSVRCTAGVDGWIVPRGITLWQWLGVNPKTRGARRIPAVKIRWIIVAIEECFGCVWWQRFIFMVVFFAKSRVTKVAAKLVKHHQCKNAEQTSTRSNYL